jgi:hypothetical protein
MYIRNSEVSLAGYQTTIEYKEMALAYRDVMSELNMVYRTSAAMVATEQALQPLYAAVTSLGPEIEEQCKHREVCVLDYDSHRRRVKGLETKREELTAKGKTSTQPYTDLLAEITRFQGKLQVSQDLFNESNSKTKKDIIDAKLAHDKLLEGLLLTTIVVQAELFAHSAKKLEGIVSQFPQAKVQQVRIRINDYIKQGGVQAPKEEKSSLVKGLNVITGKQTISELKEEEKQKEKEAFQHQLEKEKAVITIESEQKQKPAASGILPPWNRPPEAPTATRPSAPPAPKSPAPVLPVVPPPPAPPGSSSSSSNSFASKKSTSPTRNPFGDSSAPSSPMNRPSPPNGNRPPPPPAAPPSRNLGKVVALFDHTIDEADELEFRTGDIIEVLDKNDDGWWKGKCKGKEGLFPSNYVKPL